MPIRFASGPTGIEKALEAKESFAVVMDWFARSNCWRLLKLHFSASGISLLLTDCRAAKTARRAGFYWRRQTVRRQNYQPNALCMRRPMTSSMSKPLAVADGE